MCEQRTLGCITDQMQRERVGIGICYEAALVAVSPMMSHLELVHKSSIGVLSMT